MNRLKKNSDLLAAILLSVISYILIFRVSSLDFTNVNLMMCGGDLSQHYLGSVSYRLSEWSWQTLNTVIGYPYAVSVAHTDSLPIVSFLFKIFHTLFGMSAWYQFTGLWTLISFILTAIASVLIFRHLFKAKYLIVLSSLLFVLAPIMLDRSFAHATLVAHWLILFTINLYMNNRLSLKEWLYFGLLLFLSLVIHPYFSPMIIMIFLALCAKKFFNREISLATLLKGGIFLSVVSITAILWTCVLNGENAVYGWYGKLSLNLNGLFNPIWSKSLFLNTLPYSSVDPDDAYFGLGLILLLLFLLPQIKADLNKKNLYRHKEILIACLLLTLFALSPQIYLGKSLIVSYNGGPIIDWLGVMFRASSRMFWPVWYLLAIYLLKTFTRDYGKYVKIVIPLLVLIQIIDLYPTFKNKNDFVRRCSKTEYVNSLQSEKWNDIFADNKHIVMNNCTMYADILYKALEKGNTTNIGYINRQYAPITNDIYHFINLFLDGYLPYKENYVFFIDDNLYQQLLDKPQTPQIRKMKRHIKELDGYRYVVASPELYTDRDTVYYDRKIKFSNFNIKNHSLSWVEEWGRWSDGKRVNLYFDIPPTEKDVKISLNIHPFFGGSKNKQTITVYANDIRLTKWKFKQGKAYPDTTLIVPNELLKNNNYHLKLKFKIDAPKSHQQLGLGEGIRKLGIGFIDMTLSEVK